MHGFLCSDGKMEAMVDVTCKKCDYNNVKKHIDNRSGISMVLIEETEGNGNEVVNREWNKIHHTKKPKNQIQNKNNKNKHHNQDAGRGQKGTGPTGIIQTSPNSEGGRGRRGGRGKRVHMNQQHVRSTTIRFEEPKPL